MFGTQCVRLNIRSALLIVVCFFLNGIKFSSTGMTHTNTKQMTVIECSKQRMNSKRMCYFYGFNLLLAYNHMEAPTKSEIHKNSNNSSSDFSIFSNVSQISGQIQISFF